MANRGDVRGHVMDLTRGQFKEFINTALADHNSEAFKEFYDFNIGIFDVADSDNDGLVSVQGFNTLVELAAHVPRKYGYAPMTVDLFPSAEARDSARKGLFDQIRKESPSGQNTGKMTFDAWFAWVLKHVAEVTTKRGGWWSGRSSSLMGGNVSEFLNFLVAATGSSKSPEYRDLYHHLRDVFTTVDKDYDGRITPDEFSELIELAAVAPRKYGLAPETSEMFKTAAEAKASRAQLFKEIDAKGRLGSSGFITFTKLLGWALPHIKGKLAEVKKAGNPHNKHLVKYNGQHPADLTKPQLKSFLYAATTEPGSAEAKALRKWLFDQFTQADTDNDGFVRSKVHFDALIDNTGYLPRKFGYAPMAVDLYPTEEARVAARAALFTEISGGGGAISHNQWLRWCLAHIRGKVPRMGTAHELMASDDANEFVGFLRSATGNSHTPEAMEFYYFLANCFMEADTVGDGLVRPADFGALVDKAASAPRTFGLAPPSINDAAKNALFAAMDANGSGAVTFDKFLAWCMPHVAQKVKGVTLPAKASKPLPPVQDLTRLTKAEFKTFIQTATNAPGSTQRRTLHDFLLHCFSRADTEGNGLVSLQDFDIMIEMAAAVPRNHGFAPVTARTYKAEQAKIAARRKMFDEMAAGKGSVSFYQWMAWCLEHLKGKVPTMGSDKRLMEGSQADFVGFCQRATADSTSPENAELHGHLLRCFVAADGGKTGRINVDQFDALIDVAAEAPRHFGLAPLAKDMFKTEYERKAARGKLFATMDVGRTGTISYHEFLAWSVPHIREKVSQASRL